MATAATAPAPTGFFSGNINSCSSGDKSVEAVLGVTGPWNGANSGSWPATQVSGDGLDRHDQQRHHRRWPTRLRLVVEPSGRPRCRQAGPDGGAYWLYDPSVTSGTLAAYKNGEPSGGVSHVLFCYHPGSQGGDPKLLVSKTAETHITKTYDWSIAKKEKDGKTQLNGQVDGPAGTANYEIKVTKELVSTEYSVSGVITVKNDSSTDLVAATVTDTLPGQRISSWLCPAPVPLRSQPGRRSTARIPPSCPMPMLAPTRHSPIPDLTRSRTAAARRASRSTTRPR